MAPFLSRSISILSLKPRYLPRTRHIEIQVFGDQQGNVVHFGERRVQSSAPLPEDHRGGSLRTCSLAFSSEFYITPEEKSQLYSWATTLAKAARYEGAGTVEFLCDDTVPSQRRFYFMEVNTRLQVEHLVSQCINRQIDLVELQLRVGENEPPKRRLRRESRWNRSECHRIFSPQWTRRSTRVV